jgi:hypothetical protein
VGQSLLAATEGAGEGKQALGIVERGSNGVDDGRQADSSSEDAEPGEPVDVVSFPFGVWHVSLDSAGVLGGESPGIQA